MQTSFLNVIAFIVIFVGCVLIWLDQQNDLNEPMMMEQHIVHQMEPEHPTEKDDKKKIKNSSKRGTKTNIPKELEQQVTQIFVQEYFMKNYGVDIAQTAKLISENTIELQFSGRDRIIQFNYAVLLFPTSHQASTALRDYYVNPPKLFEGVVPSDLDQSMMSVITTEKPMSSMNDLLVFKGPLDTAKKVRNDKYRTYARLEQMRVMFRSKNIVHDISVIVVQDTIDALYVLNNAIKAIIS
jgi:hypothetical protein